MLFPDVNLILSVLAICSPAHLHEGRLPTDRARGYLKVLCDAVAAGQVAMSRQVTRQAIRQADRGYRRGDRTIQVPGGLVQHWLMASWVAHAPVVDNELDAHADLRQDLGRHARVNAVEDAEDLGVVRAFRRLAAQVPDLTMATGDERLVAYCDVARIPARHVTYAEMFPRK